MFEIPKVIHQIHLGDRELSLQQKEWQKTWINYNPDWKYILWNDNEISKLDLVNSKQLTNCKNFSEKSDILRFEILYQFGGLYIDTDFECLKCIDPLFEEYSFKDLIIFLETKNQIGSAFIAATKKNHSIKKLIDIIAIREKTHEKCRSDIKYGPKYITEVLGLDAGIPDGDGCQLKKVYPYIWTEKHYKFNQNFHDVYPEAYAVHHWLHSWRT